jgi:hypothetical protein
MELGKMSASNENEAKHPSSQPMTSTETSTTQPQSTPQLKNPDVAEEESTHCYCNGTDCDSPADCTGDYYGHEDFVGGRKD